MSANDTAQGKTSGGTSRGAAVVGMLVAFIGGYLLGDLTGGGDRQQAKIGKAATAKRHHVPVGLSPAKGPAAAPVTIVEFADFQCGYCARSVAVQRQLLAQYPSLVRWVFKHYPLPERIHPQAMLAAQASMAAAAQGQFWPFHDRLFKRQQQMSRDDMLAHASELGLDLARFRKELDGKAHEKAVKGDMELARRLKVQGTPNFFINGRQFSGSMSVSRLEKVVREELAYTQRLVRDGVHPAELYRKLTEEKKEERKEKKAAGEEKQAPKVVRKAP